MLKSIKLFLIAVIISMASAVSAKSAQENIFPDVPTEHWAAKAISWGVDKKVLDGYSDGRFAPEEAVTEAEFLKMVISAYESLPNGGSNWFDKYYSYAFEKGWFVKGLRDATLANKPIMRKNVAIVLSSALGKSYPNDSANTTEMAVSELYNQNLSNGKTEKTIQGFAPDDPLTRAEAVQFVYNLVNKSGLKQLKASVSDSDWSAYEKVTFSDKKGILNKHELFAKKYGLKVTTHESSGWTFINLASGSEPSTQTTNNVFNISSSYKIGSDGSVEWNLATDLDIADPFVTYELLARIFSYDTVYHDSITQKLIPSITARGLKFYEQIRAPFGKLEIIAWYDKESNNYYMNSRIAP